MKKFTLVALISLIINTLIATTCFAAGTDTNNINGIVFTDLNSNGVQELNEENYGYSIINVQELGSNLIEKLITDEQGTFHIDDLTYGKYMIWTEANGVVSEVTLIEVNEVSANAVIALGVPSTTTAIDGLDGNSTPVQMILLPFIIG